MKRLLAACVGLMMGSVWAQSADTLDHTAAYARIDAVRAQESAALDAQEAACYERFAVNRCLKQVQTRRTATLKELKRQEAALHDAERRQLGKEQRERLEQKARDAVERDAQALRDAQAQAADKQAKAQQDTQAGHTAPAAHSSPARSATGPTDASSAQVLEQNRASHARKLAAAEQKRLQLAKRRQDRSGTPLPLPGNGN